MMFQGTGSNVGKSVLVAGLCRAARRRGIRVAPFKPQNMSNNAAVCEGGGEIGRAQALQAQACGLAPRTAFNPVLLKPQSDKTSQIIINGEVAGIQDAMMFRGQQRLSLMPQVLSSFQALKEEFELVLVEGAGSPAETNLRQGDIANMGFANASSTPVTLIGDIDRGGVIAALVGTQSVLSAQDNALIRGFLINKFRGDVRLFDQGLADICERTGWESYGVVPWLNEVSLLPPEDAVPLEEPTMTPGEGALVKVAAPVLSRIANFDDLDPLRQESGVELTFVGPGSPIPLDVDAVIVLGTKSALGDLEFLRQQGWDTDIMALARAGKHILGVCGGFQLLGKNIADPDGNDGAAGHAVGLGLLDVTTRMNREKILRENSGVHKASGRAIHGYEIHVGDSSGPDASKPFAELASGADGAVSPDGKICGTYLHGLFSSDEFRKYWLDSLQPGAGTDLAYAINVEAALDQLSESLEVAIDFDRLLAGIA